MATWHHWLVAQLQTRLIRSSTTLLGVAAPTTRHDVLPSVGTPLRLGNNVIDVLGGAVAVLAEVGIPEEHSPPVQRNPTGVGDFHELPESDDGRRSQVDPLATPDLAVGRNDVRTVAQHQDDRSSHRHNRERLIRGIEH